MSCRIQLRKEQTIVFDGDSLTALRKGPTNDQWPWLRISNNHISWADTFAELVFAWRPDLKLNFRTAAVGGSNCRHLMERFDATVAKLKPDWVLLTLGSNDASHDVPLEEFEEKLRDYITRIGEWGGKIVFLYGIKACPNANERTIVKEKARLPYYAIEEKLAGEYDHVQLLDIGTPLLEKAKLHYEKYPGHTVYSDGNHFSNLGGMIIAGEVLKACGIVCPETSGRPHSE